jgi:eukaryotic-like serine/threonine-protein kinase
VPASLESVSTYHTIGDWNLKNGRWEDASKRFASVAQAISHADKSESIEISIHFVAAAAAVSDSGNIGLYERLRLMAAERFSSTTDPIIADEVIKTCLILPADSELLAKLDPLVKLLEHNLPFGREDKPEELMEAWQMLSLSLAAFREGEFEMAEKWGRRCLQHPNSNMARNPAVRTVLAMSMHQTGRENEAAIELEAARNEVKANFEKPFDLGNGWDGFWFDWMIARLLLKEADSMVP